MSILSASQKEFSRYTSYQRNICTKSPLLYALETLNEKGSGALNEDSLLIDNNLFAVFDGASSLVPNHWEGKSGAWWASHSAVSAIQAHCHNISSLSALFEIANEHIARQMTRAGINRQERLGVWSCTGAAIRLSDSKLEYAQIGDALIICIKKDGSFFLPVAYHNHDHETLEQWYTLAKQGCKNIRAKLADKIAQTRLQMNRTFGVLNGEVEMANFLRCGTIPLTEIKALLLFTDGLHWPMHYSEKSHGFSTLVENYLKHGLQNVYHSIRKTEKSDPYCLDYPRFKTHDDATAIAITFC